jgi:flavodoxin
METLHIIYASTSGNVEMVVEYAAEIWRTHNIPLELHRAEMTQASIIADNSLFVLATSTWDHGTLNPFFQPLHDAMATMSLTGKRAAFIGSGDNRYEPVHFNRGMLQLREVWQQQGGEVIHRPLTLNGDPTAKLDTFVKPWAADFLPYLTNQKGTA